MGRSPKKKPDAPETKAPETDAKAGSVRNRSGGGQKKPPAQNMELAVEALQMLSEAGADPAKWGVSYNNAAKLYGADALNAALTAKGVDLAKWLPKPEAPVPQTNLVTSSDVTTGSVVPVTSVDGTMPPVPTAEQAAALQALGLNGGNTAQAGATPPKVAADAFPSPRHIKALMDAGMTDAEIKSTPLQELQRRFELIRDGMSGPAAQAAAAGKTAASPKQAVAAPPKQPSIGEMIGMLMGQGAYKEPVNVPPVLSQVRNVDPAVAAAQPTVQLRTQDLQPKPATQPFKFPAGFDPGTDDGRVQLADVDYSNMRPVVADATTPVQWYARQGADASKAPQQLSGKKEPDPKEPPNPFADIPLDPNKGWVRMRRNRANIVNQAAPYVLGGVGAIGAGGLIYALSRMMSAQPAQPQSQGPDPDEALLMNAYQNGLR